MKSIAVYCASSFGAPLYTQVAYDVGKTLAQRNVCVIYGGSVVGVIPDFLSKLELMHPGLSEIHVVETMHQRKAKMVALSEGILVLPGGYGTLDELFEVLAWSQLRIFNGPVGILNVNGFYDLLLAHLDRAREEQFLRSENRDLIRVDDNLEGLLMQMDKFVR